MSEVWQSPLLLPLDASSPVPLIKCAMYRKDSVP